MKKITQIIIASVLVAIVALPMVALAFSGTFTRTQGITITDTTGADRTNVPVVLTGIDMATYRTSAYINLVGTNTAMVDNATGTDIQYMMQQGTNSTLVIPSLLAYSSVSYSLLMGTSVNQTGFPIITGTGGYVTTTDAPNLEGLANFSLGSSVGIGATGNITRKDNALLLSDNGTGTITGNVTGNTFSAVTGGTIGTITTGYWSRLGYKIPSLSAGTVLSANFTLYKDGLPTGTANITVRDSSDAILGLLGTQDTSLIVDGTTYTYTTPVTNPTKQDIRIQFEYTDVGGSVQADYRDTNTIYGEASLYHAGAYIPNPVPISGYIYPVFGYSFRASNAIVSATAIVSGLRNVTLINSSYLLSLYIDSVLKDSVYGVSMNNSAGDWILLSGIPYADNITYSVNSVQQIYYAPTVMIVSTTLPDRSADATTNNGIITWGANSGLTLAYGAVLDAPAIQTLSASGIQSTSAYLAGQLTSLGASSDVLAGFQWGLDTSYGAGSTPEVLETSPTTYFYQLTTLSPSTTYHYRAYVKAGALTLYGEDKYFTTQPVAGSSTTILIRSAKIFQNYITTGDYLLVAEVLNNYTGMYPDETPREHFTIQLLDLDNTTILGASPLTNWGDRPASIYFNPTAGAGFISGANYFVKMIGDNITGYAATEYTLQVLDWKGADLGALDSWNIGTAINMAIADGVSVGTYVAYPTNQSAVINDAAGGFFTTGIPAIVSVRPHSFATAQYQTTVTAGTASNAWDKTDADPTGWRAFVGTSLAADIDRFALPFGITGKDYAAGMVMLAMLGCVMFVVGSGGAQALGGLFISIPILWLGVFARAVPIAAIIMVIIFFSAFAIRQFVVKTL